MKKTNNEINVLLRKPTKLYEKFHNATKINNFPKESDTVWPESWKKVYFKAYSRAPAIVLPKPKVLKVSLHKALCMRKSSREYDVTKPLKSIDISTILYYSFGIREQSEHMRGNRFYPSGGSRYPLEVYILSLNTSLPNCLLHYYVKGHLLEQLFHIEKKEIMEMFHQDFIANAGCIVVITAVFKRTTIKYGDRGYRHILAEAGHAAQDIYLTSAALGVGCCAIGGYREKKLEDLLDINGVDESIVYIMAIGRNL